MKLQIGVFWAKRTVCNRCPLYYRGRLCLKFDVFVNKRTVRKRGLSYLFRAPKKWNSRLPLGQAALTFHLLRATSSSLS